MATSPKKKWNGQKTPQKNRQKCKFGTFGVKNAEDLQHSHLTIGGGSPATSLAGWRGGNKGIAHKDLRGSAGLELPLVEKNATPTDPWASNWKRKSGTSGNSADAEIRVFNLFSC